MQSFSVIDGGQMLNYDRDAGKLQHIHPIN